MKEKIISIFILIIILIFLNLTRHNTNPTNLENTYNVTDTIPLKIPIIDERILNQSMDLTWEITHPYLQKELPSYAFILKNGSKIENIENKTTITNNNQLSFRTIKAGTYDINIKVKNNNQLILNDNITLNITHTPADDYEKKRNFFIIFTLLFIIFSLSSFFIGLMIIGLFEFFGCR